MARVAAEAERAEALARWRLARCEAAQAAALAAVARYREEALPLTPEPDPNTDRLLWASQTSRMRARSAERAARYGRLHDRLAERAQRRRAALQAAAQARAACERRLEALAGRAREREQGLARHEAEERLITPAPQGVRP